MDIGDIGVNSFEENHAQDYDHIGKIQLELRKPNLSLEKRRFLTDQLQGLRERVRPR